MQNGIFQDIVTLSECVSETIEVEILIGDVITLGNEQFIVIEVNPQNDIVELVQSTTSNISERHQSPPPARSEHNRSSKVTETEKVISACVVKASGARALQGRRASMEDTFTIIPEFIGCREKFFAGVYDGHGGICVADYAKEHLHVFLENELQKPGVTASYALRHAFAETDAGAEKACPKHEGATAIVALIDGKMLYIAGAGDARAVLDRGGVAVQLSQDHKAHDPKEKTRIESAGGSVKPAVNEGVARVTVPGSVFNYAITRGIGDAEAGKIISPEPDIQDIALQPGDDNLILACDGVWDVITSQKAVDLIRGIEDPNQAADFLAQEAFSSGSTDNISVVIVNLNVKAINSKPGEPHTYLRGKIGKVIRFLRTFHKPRSSGKSGKS
jgi:protein phosphatase 1L